MLATATQETEAITKQRSQFQRLAWIILLVSFVMFCSLSIASTGIVYFFLFRSTLPMEISMEVGRGSVGLSAVDYEQIVRNRDLPTSMSDRPSTISTDSLSQATVSLQINSNAIEVPNTVIGTLSLKNSSSITLQSARQPRFDWSDGLYTIEFSNFSGEADIFLTNTLERPFRLQIHTQLGETTFLFDTIGRYTITATPTAIRLSTYSGRALLVSPNNQNNRLAVAGQQVELLTGANIPVVTSTPVDLLENGLFTFRVTRELETGNLSLPPRWGCFNTAEALPTGSYFPYVWEGRTSIRLIREVGDSNSETGCRQLLDTSVAQYSYLELQTTFAINHQSLENCGVKGSECPMMIFITYEDTEGFDRTWYQGLFYNYDAQSASPLQCLECGAGYQHSQIADQVWYTYESGNLFTRLTARPARIKEVEFYASGHRYDVLISEIALFAGSEQAVVPNVPESDGN